MIKSKNILWLLGIWDLVFWCYVLRSGHQNLVWRHYGGGGRQVEIGVAPDTQATTAAGFVLVSKTWLMWPWCVVIVTCKVTCTWWPPVICQLVKKTEQQVEKGVALYTQAAVVGSVLIKVWNVAETMRQSWDNKMWAHISFDLWPEETEKCNKLSITPVGKSSLKYFVIENTGEKRRWGGVHTEWADCKPAAP